MEPIRIDHRLHSISLRFSIPPNIRTGGWQGTTRQDHFHLQKGRAFLPSILTLLIKIVAGLNPYLPVYSDASPKRSTWDTTTANYPLRPYLAASKINSGMSCHTTGSSSFVFETKMNLYFDRPSSSTSSFIRSSKAMDLTTKDNSKSYAVGISDRSGDEFSRVAPKFRVTCGDQSKRFLLHCGTSSDLVRGKCVSVEGRCSGSGAQTYPYLLIGKIFFNSSLLLLLLPAIAIAVAFNKLTSHRHLFFVY